MPQRHRGAAAALLVALTGAAVACGRSAENPLGPGTNRAPEIHSVTATPPVVPLGGTSLIRVDAADPDGDRLFFTYAATAGTVVPDAANPSQATYTHNGSSRASDQVTVTVVDGKNATAQGSVTLSLQANQGPQVQITGGGASCHPPCTLPLSASATDPEGDTLTYAWFGCASGSARTAECSVRYPGAVEAAVVVLDGRGGMATTAVTVTGTNRPPTIDAPNGLEFSGGKARFTVLYDDPDRDDPVCGWIGFCQCTGSVQSYNLDCVVPEGVSSCRQTMTCTDAFGAKTERSFNLRR